MIEQMVSDDPGATWAKMLDIHMLALLGGRQRTQGEYAALLERAGFVFQREVATPVGISIVEARAA